MKRLFLVSFFSALSLAVFGQDAKAIADGAPAKNYTKKYFVATNSGILSTPVGFRVGFLDRRGGYLAARFGKGHNYELDQLGNVRESKGTMFSTTVGFIFPLYCKGGAFNAHIFAGFGYGQWFDRPSTNEFKMGLEVESGVMLSYNKLFTSLGGNLLTGDGKTPKKDIAIGIGYRIY